MVKYVYINQFTGKKITGIQAASMPLGTVKLKKIIRKTK